MGSSASKAAGKAGPRRFPTSPRPVQPPPARPQPQRPPLEEPRDMYTPPTGSGYSDRLHQIGIVQPMPTYSATSTAGTRGQPVNATLSVLEARRRLQEEQAAEEEGGLDGAQDGGREFLAAGTLREILQMRAQGVDAAVIEQRLRLKAGVVSRLGPRGLVEALS